ncbi:asparagine synthase-domain-containing protein [Xylaria nigripes]|nr:asparagine synthase-domain-containing protein [Xylaria nigripes]
MCGIHATITTSADSGLSPDFKQALINRGPDHFGHTHRENADQKLRLYFTSTVLALRGDHVAKQPLEEHTGTGSVLCWNGEAWRVNGQPVGGNDSEAIFSMLQSSAVSSQTREGHIADVLRSIEGPFAFVYYDSTTDRVYFGRDRLGRRSLLIKHSSDNDRVTLSSIPFVPMAGWKEVGSDGIWSVDLRSYDKSGLSLQDRVTKHAWIESNKPGMVSNIGVFNNELPPPNRKLDFSSPSLQILKRKLVESLRPRVLDVPEPPNATSDIDVRIAVLFSGGLDCTILARLTHDLVPLSQGLDLINVAFENPRQVALEAKQPHLQASDIYESCPDRVTGRKAFAELKSCCPGRLWRFITVNVPFEEAMTHKSKILSLIYPHDTEMDLSIAFALYFAARGTGDCYIDQVDWQSSPPIVSTSARVLLSGLGADELFGGYSRHEAAFKRSGYSGLIDELKLDVSRIGERNLGRDDRIMANWGREVRFPYLDEEFVNFAITSAVWEKCDFENTFHPAVIDPAKRILRLLADQLNLPVAARQKKKAIQFGSRTAKIESSTGRLRGTAQVVLPFCYHGYSVEYSSIRYAS